MHSLSRDGWALVLAACLFVMLPSLHAGDFDVLISELHYHPPAGTAAEEGGEFIELTNLSDSSVDLSYWYLHDDALLFEFPFGTRIQGHGFVVVARDAAYVESTYGVAPVYGNILGRLSNSGERITLRNRKNVLIDQVQYADGKPWPETPDGEGASLEKAHLLSSGEDQASWRASIFLGGTPGSENSTHGTTRNDTLVAAGASWMYRKGTAEPASPMGAWARENFSDASWTSGPSGFGYGDGDDATVLLDMAGGGGYTTLYIRKHVTVPSLENVQSLQLSIVYDDAYVAYLNGTEVGRSPSAGGTPGTPLPFDARAATTHENDEGSGLVDLQAYPGLLRAGDNVLAIQGLNESSGSSDFSLIPTVTILYEDTTGVIEPAHDVEINEVFAGDGVTAGFVELHNEGATMEDISGYRLTASPAGEPAYVLPAGTTVEPGAFVVVEAGDLPFALIDDRQWLALTTDDLRLVDGIATRTRPSGSSWGRYPDGDGDTFVLEGPSPGSPDAVALEDRIVIDEIQFHPPLDVQTAEYIELYNRGPGEVDLTGWSLSGAVSFPFATGTKLAAGSFLVVSGDPTLVEARHGVALVLGPWSGKLANSSEKIEVQDALGNVVDVVHYADDGRWPLSTDTAGPDGFGPSIELVHPATENNHGSAWRASTGIGTPGAANSRAVSDPAPVIRSVSHSPATPRSSETVTVTARVADERGVASVSVLSRLEGAASFTRTTLLDDSLHGDGASADGRYGATLPQRPDGAVVEFYLEATDTTGHTRTYPSDAPTRACLYQVIDASPSSGLPLYRTVLRDADVDELIARSLQSNVLLDGTFIRGSDITYNVGVRYRGENSRNYPIKSFRIQFTDDEPFEDITDLNLNGEDSAKAHMAADFFRRAGMPVFQTRPVLFTLNDAPEGRHGGVRLRVENYDHFFVDRQFPDDADGNLYRGLDLGSEEGDLSYKGPDPASYVDIYAKRTNQEENDYSDVIELTRVFTETPAEEFAAAIADAIDVPQWIRYFAVETVLNNRDGCIARGSGEDYFIYHRPSDGRWVLLPWDQNETFTVPDNGIYRQEIAAIQRLVLDPEFNPLYEEDLRALLDGPFQEGVMSRSIDAVRDAFAEGELDDIQGFVSPRIETIRGLLPAGADREFIRGDSNDDGFLDISDAVTVLLYLFEGAGAPDCLDAVDSDDSGTIDLTDSVYVLQYLFTQGPNLPAPFPLPGADPTPSDPYGCPAP